MKTVVIFKQLEVKDMWKFQILFLLKWSNESRWFYEEGLLVAVVIDCIILDAVPGCPKHDNLPSKLSHQKVTILVCWSHYMAWSTVQVLETADDTRVCSLLLIRRLLPLFLLACLFCQMSWELCYSIIFSPFCVLFSIAFHTSLLLSHLTSALPLPFNHSQPRLPDAFG